MKKIYAAPISGDWYAVFVGDQKLTLPLSEADAKKIADRYNGFEELERENKRLALQVEVLSAAFANSSEKEKESMAERDELLDFLENVAFPKRGSDAEKWNLSDVTALATRLYKKHRFEPAKQPLPDTCQDTLSFVGGCVMPPNSCKKCFNPADLDEQSA